jgi:hypothetical protein
MGLNKPRGYRYRAAELVPGSTTLAAVSYLSHSSSSQARLHEAERVPWVKYCVLKTYGHRNLHKLQLAPSQFIEYTLISVTCRNN